MTEDFERITEEPVPDTATQHMVRMRDGVRLATDVYLPEGGAPAEAVLVRLPYEQEQPVRVLQVGGGPLHRARLRHGGAGRPGQVPVRRRDARVRSGHRALRAIVPRVTTANLLGPPHVDGPVRDVPWLVHQDYVSHYWVDNHIYWRPLNWNLRPLTEVFEDQFRAIGGRSAAYDASVPHPVPLPIYTEGHPFDGRPIPVLHSVGWFDNLAIVSMRDYMTLSRKPGWAPLQYLTADSVDHENYHLRHAPIAEPDDHGVNDEALSRMLANYTQPALDFFDVFLKGIRDASTLPQVSWHLGHEDYHEAPSWPPPGACEQDLYLAGLATAATSGGLLTGQGPGGDEATGWEYDPEDLVASSVPNSFAFLHEFPDEAATAQRPDVLHRQDPQG